jgi:hypothetical protein
MRQVGLARNSRHSRPQSSPSLRYLENPECLGRESGLDRQGSACCFTEGIIRVPKCNCAAKFMVDHRLTTSREAGTLHGRATR